MTGEQAEPSDGHIYNWVMFYASTWRTLLASVTFYERLLSADIEAIEEDADLALLVDEEKRKSLLIYQERSRAARMRDWMTSEIDKRGAGAWDLDVSLSHGTARYLKATASLYLAHLRNRRNALSGRPNVSRYALESVDTELARLGELLGSGVFEKATPTSLLFDELTETAAGSNVGSRPESLASSPSPRPVVISSIEILDPELRSRCLDLFEAFRVDGQRDRLDTVVTEATRVLEHKLRRLCGAPDDLFGVDLAKLAFGGDRPYLMVSDVKAEQEAAYLMYRGVFGFVRNQVHHRLSGELAPERVLQVLGMIDYLMALAQGARRQAGPVVEDA